MIQSHRLVALLATIISCTAVVGYPDGAPVCTIGGSATNNLHLLPSQKPQSLKFSDDGIEVQINGRLMAAFNNDSPDFYNIFQARADNNVTIKSSNTTWMKGILAILHGGDYDTIDTRTPGALNATDTRLQMSYGPGNGCENYDVAAIIQKDRTI